MCLQIAKYSCANWVIRSIPGLQGRSPVPQLFAPGTSHASTVRLSRRLSRRLSGARSPTWHGLVLEVLFFFTSENTILTVENTVVTVLTFFETCEQTKQVLFMKKLLMKEREEKAKGGCSLM